VPGRTTLLFDQRNLDAAELAEMLAEMRAAAESAAEAERCSVEFEHLWRIEPIPFDERLVAAATAACREVAGTDRQLPSGPLHDAAEMARRVPTVMIFSSSTNGLSHTKEEDTPVEHLELAARAFGLTASAAIASAH
jgi:acetylornithine deacetylase/succinyl-diaminopimelate desuccinylase-like protein